MPQSPHRIFAAVDTTDLTTARALARALAGHVGGLKLGLEFFVAHGPQGINTVMDGTGVPLFLDLKLHDIPNTVAGGVRAAVAVKPAFLTIHTGGGRAMMKAAADEATDAAAKAGVQRPRILGVTILTSMDQGDLASVGVDGSVLDQVKRLVALARESGLDGVVCSPWEVTALRSVVGPDFVLMVPGIRPAGAAGGDQKRVMTPAEAIGAGASYLVIGRPITQADNPAQAAEAIAAEMGDKT